MNIFKRIFGMNNPLEILDEINKIRNKKKRNDENIKEKQSISEELENELNALSEKYYKETANETFLSLSDLIGIFGEESVTKAKNSLKHISRIKDDGKWVQSRIPCWICEQNSHNNVCHDNKACDRGLEKCIGTKVLLLQIKEEDQGKLF